MTGVLAVWNDHAGDDAAYEAWYQEEHVPQRLGFAGFREARRYLAVAADRQYFTWYGLDDVSCLHAPDYLACLAEPTSRTRAIMPGFRGMIRAEMDVVAAAGRGLGGYAVCVRTERRVGMTAPALSPGVVCVQAWKSVDSVADSPETRFRGAPDGRAAEVLLMECLRLEVAQRAAVTLRDAIPAPDALIGIYQLMSCTLR